MELLWHRAGRMHGWRLRIAGRASYGLALNMAEGASFA